ncbi:MAG: ABC-2 family transporter protein [Bdellovibrionales bacterium]|nr:ABC-2 family transporter protein [Bdellovibrionales bacterium]
MILRYLKLYRQFLLFSISKTAEFRMDFFARIIMDVIYYGTNIYFFKVIFLHSSALAGWTESQVMVFVGIFLMMDGLNMTIFANNLWWISNLVNKGELDYYLLRPVSSLFFLSTREVAINSFINLLFAGGIFAWAIASYPHSISWDRYLLMSFLFVLGFLLYFFLRIIFILPVFWTHGGKGGELVFWTLNRLLERPDRIFRSWMRVVVITILPFGVMSSYPAHVLWEADVWPFVTGSVVVTLVFGFLTVALWKFALRSYSSASS